MAEKSGKKASGRVKVSVLVPIYNVEKYLKKSLNSLRRQTLGEIEFICINDGSTDGGSAILREFAQNDRRFVVINKKNSGYGDSLNLGVSRARGEYIGIVEPDDFVEPETFAELYTCASGQHADVVRANYFHHDQTGDRIFKQVSEAEASGKITNDDFHRFYQPPAIWSGLYRAEFLRKHRIQFLSTAGASYQDTGFFWKTLACAEKMAFLKKAFYHYRTDNENSSVKNLAKVDAVRTEYAEIENFLRKHGLHARYGGVMQATKFATYHWNLLRLAPQFLDRFVPEMRAEFLRAWEAGDLERKYFPGRHWLALKMLLKSKKLFKAEVLAYRALKGVK